MSISNPLITPCLWFDNEGEDAARFYTSIFPDSEILHISHYTESPQVGHEIHKQPAGKVLTVSFKLSGTPFVALNGGPQFKFSEAVSFQIDCKNQEEVDYYWTKLLDGGRESSCGWLKDKFGLSWQVVPIQLKELLAGDDKEGAKRAMDAMMGMVKLDIAQLQKAYDG